MKTLYSLIATAIVLSIVPVKAQITGGGAGSDGSGKAASSSGIFRNSFYMKGGFSHARG